MSGKQVDYDIITADTRGQLVDYVQEYISHGWQTDGGVTVMNGYLMQVVVRLEVIRES